MAKGFESPTTALAAIVECLSLLCDRIHVGSLGTGETLACCPGCLLRVESAGLRVPDGLARSLINMKRCNPLILDVVINYRECFQSFSADGKNSRTVTQLTEDGTALLLTWWNALRTLVCCDGLNQVVRFTSIADVAPEGNCAGWTMALEVDVSMCGCADPA